MNRILSLIGVVLVVGCGPEPRDMETLDEVSGVYMNPGDGQPYSGPVYFMVDQLDDYRRVTGSLRDGKWNGPWEMYDLYSQSEEKRTYTDGYPDGLYEGYYDNGQLWERVTYEDGERDGLYEGYYNNGLLGSKVTYKNGKWDGPYESYLEDGQLLSKGTYRDGKKCGGWLDFGETVTYDPC